MYIITILRKKGKIVFSLNGFIKYKFLHFHFRRNSIQFLNFTLSLILECNKLKFPTNILNNKTFPRFPASIYSCNPSIHETIQLPCANLQSYPTHIPARFRSIIHSYPTMRYRFALYQASFLTALPAFLFLVPFFFGDPE